MRNRAKLKPGDAVYIEWLDAASMDGDAWRTRAQIDSLGSLPRLKTMGWVHKVSKEALVIYSTTDVAVSAGEEPHFWGELAVPWGMLQFVERLTLKGIKK